MPTVIKCRAKDPTTCAYHGTGTNKSLREQKLATLMEAAANEFDLETYHRYHLELDALQGKIIIADPPTLDLDERVGALRDDTDPRNEEDPYGDDENLEEHNRYTLVRDKVNWRTFTDLTKQEQEDVFWLTRNDMQTQVQVAEYGTRDVQDLLARTGGNWLTLTAWRKLVDHGDEYVVTHVHDNPDTPPSIKNYAANMLESMTGRRP